MSEVKKRKVRTPDFKVKVGLEVWRLVKTINGKCGEPGAVRSGWQLSR